MKEKKGVPKFIKKFNIPLQFLMPAVATNSSYISYNRVEYWFLFNEKNPINNNILNQKNK